MCCQVLAESFRDGYSWVAEALDHHLLESILKCQPLLDSNADVNNQDGTEPLLQSSLVELLDLVNSYLIYRPVYEALEDLSGTYSRQVWKMISIRMVHCGMLGIG